MEQNTSSNQTYDTPEPPVTPSKFVRATFVADKIKVGAKRLIGRGDEESLHNDSDAAEDLFEDAAFNPQQILEAHEKDENEQDSFKDKLHRGAHGLAAIIKNPRQAARSKYARTVAGNLGGGPYEQKYDTELVDAHDAFHAAADENNALHQRHIDNQAHHRSRASDAGIYFSDTDTEEVYSTSRNMEEAQARFQKVMEQRDSLRIAWILGRHVKRIRVSKPMEHRPRRSEFTTTSPLDGRKTSVQWGDYLGQLVLWYTRAFTPQYIDDFDELPFDLRDMSLTFERLVAVSAPWQNFFIDVRNIYLWKDPRRTLKYMTLYWVLWYIQHFATALFAWVIVATIVNRYKPTRIETIRERAQRAQDGEARAQAWGEMIQRYGKQDWIEPFLDEMGPMIQLEITDMSNLLEILESFYRWERPHRTARTLFFFSVCLLISLVTSMEFCVKLFWLGAGGFFFCSLPLSARYPKYRKLFNPIYWIFWDIPNMAEIAFTQLQAKAIVRDAARLQDAERPTSPTEDYSSSTQDSDSSIDSIKHLKQDNTRVSTLKAIRDKDQMTFRAIDSEKRIRGRLTLQRHGLWYHNKQLKSYYPYSRLIEVRKIKLGSINDQDTSRKARIARRIEKSTSLQFLPSGIEFIFLPADPDITGPKLPTSDSELLSKKEQLALTVSESDRHRIFSLVISWSNLKWQPQFTLNERHSLTQNADNPSKVGKGNENLDSTIKSFVH